MAQTLIGLVKEIQALEAKGDKTIALVKRIEHFHTIRKQYGTGSSEIKDAAIELAEKRKIGVIGNGD